MRFFYFLFLKCKSGRIELLVRASELSYYVENLNLNKNGESIK
jgi:hypothetical protein